MPKKEGYRGLTPGDQKAGPNYDASGAPTLHKANAPIQQSGITKTISPQKSTGKIRPGAGTDGL